MITVRRCRGLSFFFFNDTATTEIYTLSLHDALPISTPRSASTAARWREIASESGSTPPIRSEEHTSELQSQSNLVCRLLLEKKNNNIYLSSPREADRCNWLFADFDYDPPPPTPTLCV